MPLPVAITGVGVVSAFGDSRDGFRDALLAGASGIAVVPAFEAAGCRSVLAARVSRFDAAGWISPMKLRRMDESGPFALVAIRQALEQAGIPVTDEGHESAGVVLGTWSAGGQATNDYLAALFRGGPTGAPALLFNSTVSNAAAGLAGLEFKLRGPNATVSQKEASSLAAIASAVDLLRNGRATVLAAGGMDVAYEIFFRAHDRFRVMNEAREPGAATAPFSRTRRGFVMGEGGFALVLEPASGARTRGALALGEILGVGAASAVVPLNQWPDDPAPLVRAMRMALDDAQVSPAEIDVVYASANATSLDVVEARALRDIFAGSSPLVTSIKGAIGESGAGGSAACVAALLCGATGQVPPVAGLVEEAPDVGGLRLVRTTTAGRAQTVLINSFASGGALVSVVLRVLPGHLLSSRGPQPS